MVVSVLLSYMLIFFKISTKVDLNTLEYLKCIYKNYTIKEV